MTEQKLKYSSPPTFLEVVKVNFKKLFILTMIILVVAAVSVLIKPLQYSSSATLLFPSGGGKLSLLSSGGGDLPSLPVMEGALLVPQPGSSNSTAVTLIRSVRSKKLILKKMKSRGYDVKSLWKQDKINLLYKDMDDALNIVVGKNNELFLTISSKAYEDDKGKKDYKFAINYMQSVLETMDDITSELPLDPAKQGEKYLKEQIFSVSKELNEASEKLKYYQKKYLLIDPTSQAKSLVDKYSSVKSSVIEMKIQAELSMKQLHDMSGKTEELVKASIDPASTDGIGFNSNSSGTLNALYTKVTTVESELALLKLKLRDAHPDVVNKKAELTEVKNRLQKEMKRQLGLAREGLSPGIYNMAIQALVAQAKLDGYRSAEIELKKQIEKMPDMSLNYVKLQAVVNEKTEVLTLLKTEYEKTRVVAETRGPSYVILDSPEQSFEPDSRGGGKTCMLAFVLAMMACSVICYLEWAKYQPAETQTQ